LKDYPYGSNGEVEIQTSHNKSVFVAGAVIFVLVLLIGAWLIVALGYFDSEDSSINSVATSDLSTANPVLLEKNTGNIDHLNKQPKQNSPMQLGGAIAADQKDSGEELVVNPSQPPAAVSTNVVLDQADDKNKSSTLVSEQHTGRSLAPTVIANSNRQEVDELNQFSLPISLEWNVITDGDSWTQVGVLNQLNSLPTDLAQKKYMILVDADYAFRYRTENKIGIAKNTTINGLNLKGNLSVQNLDKRIQSINFQLKEIQD
jgi:hypothetical protein